MSIFIRKTQTNLEEKNCIKNSLWKDFWELQSVFHFCSCQKDLPEKTEYVFVHSLGIFGSHSLLQDKALLWTTETQLWWNMYFLKQK